MTGLQVSPELALSVDFVTKTTGILAQRRKGKTYTAAVIAEELYQARLPWAALDPTGAWWGLRSSADGESDGIPVVIFGGLHGDIPLEETGGTLVADCIVDEPGWYIIDLSLLPSRAAERRFATAFADRLFRRKSAAKEKTPQHLFVDEADMFMPQDREAGDNPMLGAFQSIIRRGGLHGLGTTLISQRAALVNKSCLTQLDMLILLRIVAGNDQDYLEKNYVKRAGTKEQVAELMGSLASLKLGEAWLWDPGDELFTRTLIRERHTFNSSATPKHGEIVVEPKRLAPVAIDSLKERMAETIEKAEAENPKKLQARIRELERELKAVANAPAAATVEAAPQIVEVAHIPPSVEALMPAVGVALGVMLNEVRTVLEARTDQVLVEIKETIDRIHEEADEISSTPGPPPPPPRPGPLAPPVPPRPRTVSAPVEGLTDYDTSLLEELARRYPLKPTRKQLALMAGRGSKSSAMDGALKRLDDGGYINRTAGKIEITDRGRDICPGELEAPASADELAAMWISKLDAGPGAILRAVIESGPNGLTRGEACERANRSSTSSATDGALKLLVDNGLIHRTGGLLVASDDLLY